MFSAFRRLVSHGKAALRQARFLACHAEKTVPEQRAHGREPQLVLLADLAELVPGHGTPARLDGLTDRNDAFPRILVREATSRLRSLEESFDLKKFMMKMTTDCLQLHALDAFHAGRGCELVYKGVG
ncbi:MAG: hypothetical protein IPK26_22235 [Planctomycetes bacterium]|nr:hypothetical protein [Planctomycetota bacterium]